MSEGYQSSLVFLKMWKEKEDKFYVLAYLQTVVYVFYMHVIESDKNQSGAR